MRALLCFAKMVAAISRIGKGMLFMGRGGCGQAPGVQPIQRARAFGGVNPPL